MNEEVLEASLEQDVNSKVEETWEKSYEWAKKGADRNKKAADLGNLNPQVFQLITLAATYHRDKVLDMWNEVNQFKINEPALAKDLKVKALLDALVGIVNRPD